MDQIITNASPTEKPIWEEIKRLIGTSFRRVFDSKDDLSLKVEQAIIDYKDEEEKRQKYISNWFNKAAITFEELLTDDTLQEYQNEIKQIREEVDNDEDIIFIRAIAYTYVLTRLGQNSNRRMNLAESWLNETWLMLVEHKTVKEMEILTTKTEDLKQAIASWQAQVTIEWFQRLSPAKRALILRWVLRKGLVYRYSWDFKQEVRLLTAFYKLAEKVKWEIGAVVKRETLKDKFLELYLSALGYAQEKRSFTKFGNLKAILEYIQNLNLVEPTPESRKLQLQGMTVAVLSSPIEGIDYYWRALDHYKMRGYKNIRSVSQCYIMIAAMMADGKTPQEIKDIKEKTMKDFKSEVGKELTEFADIMYKRVWDRCNPNFRLIWKNKRLDVL